MALSIFCSFLPFYWWQRNSFTFFLVSVFSLFVMFNTYQASSGIYIVIVLFLTFKQLLAGENFIALCKKVALAAIAYLLSIVSYLIELKFVPSATNNIGAVRRYQVCTIFPVWLIKIVTIIFQSY